MRRSVHRDPEDAGACPRCGSSDLGACPEDGNPPFCLTCGWHGEPMEQDPQARAEAEAEAEIIAQGGYEPPRRAAKRYTVTVTELGERGRDRTTRVLAEDEIDARCRGVAKIFGPRAFWFPDSGLRTGDPSYGYGQVFEPLERELGGGNTSRTGRARFTVEAGW